MFTVANAAGVRIAQFRTMSQIDAWAKRTGLIRENVTITWRPELVNENESVMPGY